MRVVYAREGIPLVLGHQGENQVSEARFSVGLYEKQLPGCAFVLTHRRPGEANPSPVLTELYKGELIWPITASDTALCGKGLCQVNVTLNGRLMKSRLLDTRVLPALDPPGPAPAPWQSWVDQVICAGGQAEIAAGSAAESAAAALEHRETAEQAALSALDSSSSADQSRERAEQAADRAEQAAEDAGYMQMEIDENGHLIYWHTQNVDNIGFELESGRLILEVD